MLFSLDFSDWKVSIVNVTLLLIIILGTYKGFKNGFLQSTIKFVGVLVALVLAFLFKNPVSVLMYTYLPFFKLGGAFKGVSVINILIYEFIAFLILFVVFMIILDIISKVTGLISKLFSIIAFIGLPNKILGAVVGFIESMIFLYFACYIFIFGCRYFNVEIKESLADQIIKIPILNDTFGDSLNSLNEIAVLTDEYSQLQDKSECNYEALDILLKYNVITKENAEKLINSGKISIDDSEELLNKYN